MKFDGEAAKTKKQAEKNAAMAAWSALKQCTVASPVILLFVSCLTLLPLPLRMSHGLVRLFLSESQLEQGSCWLWVSKPRSGLSWSLLGPLQVVSPLADVSYH